MTWPKALKAQCLWCGQPLRFIPGQGWTHPDGTVIVTRDGRDDHIATPDFGKGRR